MNNSISLFEWFEVLLNSTEFMSNVNLLNVSCGRDISLVRKWIKGWASSLVKHDLIQLNFISSSDRSRVNSTTTSTRRSMIKIIFLGASLKSLLAFAKELATSISSELFPIMEWRSILIKTKTLHRGGKAYKWKSTRVNFKSFSFDLFAF